MTGVQQSPAPTASERFQSPIPCGFAKKRLFIEHGTGAARTVKPGQSLLNTSQLSAAQTKTISAVNVPSKKILSHLLLYYSVNNLVY